jgi:hypothetical protein
MLRRRALLMLLGAGLLVSATTGLAAAAVDRPASTPGWRPVAELGPPNGVTYVGGLVATGPKDAWSTWSDCNPCGGPNPKVDVWLEHWAGGRWRRVSVPPAVGRFLRVVNGIAATSGNDLWMFTTGRAAHWNGKHWGIMKIPSWVVRFNLSGTVAITVADFGPHNLWVFSSGIDSFKPVTPFAARYNGHRWTKAVLPGVPGQVSVVGPDDIWATAVPTDLKGGDSLLIHWNGKSWSKTPAPKPRDVSAHFTPQIEDLLALGPQDVWMQQDIANSQSISRTQLFLHWNGHTWQTVTYRWPTSSVQFMAPDGDGGLWMSDVGETARQLRYLIHDTKGHWTRQLVPAPAGMGVQQLLTLNRIPGTRSMWASGGVYPLHTNTIVIGEIWKYGT